MITLMNSLEQKRSLDQQKIQASSAESLNDSPSTNGQSTIFDLRDFGRVMCDALKNKQKPIQELKEEDREAIGKLDLSPEELKDETLLGHLRSRGKFKETYTNTDARVYYALPSIKKTLNLIKENIPVLLQDIDYLIERLDEKTEECNDLKEKLDHLTSEFILAAYRANQWQAMYEKSTEYLKQWHETLIKKTHLQSPSQSLRR